MKTIITCICCIFLVSISYPQDDTIDKIILIPHPRNNDQIHQGVQQAIEKIDLSNYDMRLLGGDLTYYTTIDRATMDYSDSLFDLGNVNTLWSVGNHDLNHPEYISDYTHRPTYYAYYIQHMTFVVLNTELDATGFVSSYISGDQLAMVQQVADTISNSKYLILLQHRLLWMIGNDDLAGRLDSVGQSTGQLDTSNFYQEVYPLLQQVKNKGIQIICLGGDRADINIEYSPEDSITYLASTMVPEFSDTVNHVIILTWHHMNDSISWEFVPLADIEETIPPVTVNRCSEEENPYVYFDATTHDVVIRPAENTLQNLRVSIFDIAGRQLYSEKVGLHVSAYRIHLEGKGVFVVEIKNGHAVFTKKIVLP
jgi:hypothetical protein